MAQGLHNNQMSTKARAQILPSFVDDAAFAVGKGSAAAAGDRYWNTTSNKSRVHNGTAFVDEKTRIFKDPKTIVSQNTIPNLTFTPLDIDSVQMFVFGDLQSDADFTINGGTPKQVAWNPSVAGYDIDPGDPVYFVYETEE